MFITNNVRGDREVMFETASAALNSVVLFEDLIVHSHLRNRQPVDAAQAAILQSIPARGLEAMLCFALSLVRTFETPIG